MKGVADVFSVQLGTLAVAVLVLVSLLRTSESAFAVDVVIVVSGSSADHTCALLVDNEVRCWGKNQFGQLGDGTTLDRPLPVSVPVGAAVDLAVGGHHTCAALTDGSVWCWGRNTDGQLGDGLACGIVCPPVQAVGIGDAVGVAAGAAHSCATLASDDIACWGNHDHGQIGLGGGVGQDQPKPVVVSIQDVAVAVAAGDWHTCGLMETGNVKCWGENLEGQLGDGLSNVNAEPSPRAVIGLANASKLSLGAEYSCAIAAGNVHCWGLGYGLTPTKVPLADAASDVGAGGRHSCAVVLGWTECWGENGRGQLGQPTDAVQVTAGRDHSCASTASGFAKCWGANDSGQLGDGTVQDSAVPVTALLKAPEQQPVGGVAELPGLAPPTRGPQEMVSVVVIGATAALIAGIVLWAVTAAAVFVASRE